MGVDAGGGVVRTDWRTMPVAMIWPLLKGHDSSPHRIMGDAWWKSSELLANHVTQVRAYRDKLMEAWPPEKSRAAAAYLERLEGLIASLEETQLASSTNWRALIGGVDAVDEAKERLAALEKEYTQHTAAIEAYEKSAAMPVLATTDPLPTPPAAAYARRNALEKEARATMQSLSAELAATQSTFIAPKPYDPSRNRMDGMDSGDTGGTGFVPPIATPAFSPRSLTPSKVSKPVSADPVREVPVPGPGGGAGLPDTPAPSGEGPILGGTKTQPAPPPVLPTTTVTMPTTTSTTPFTFTPGPPPTSPLASTPLSRNPVTGSSPAGNVPPATGGRGVSATPNGVIGGSPSGFGGQAGPGQMGGGRGSVPGAHGPGGQRVNPVGGMIGGTGTGTGMGSGAPMGRRSSAPADEESRQRQWDPDNPWETSEGIDPVLLPPTVQRIDPGPAIGGR